MLSNKGTKSHMTDSVHGLKANANILNSWYIALCYLNYIFALKFAAMSCDDTKEGESTNAQILESCFETIVKETPILEPSSSARSEQDESFSSDVDVYHMNIAVDIIERCAETEDLELDNEFLAALNEIEGQNVFPCSKCSKICKSKGGLTKHTNSKHGGTSTPASVANVKPLCKETLISFVSAITRNVIDEHLYGDEIEAAIKKASVTQGLLDKVVPLYNKFCKNRNQDKLLESFYGLMPESAKLLNCKDSRVANIVMIHIPDHLVGFVNVNRMRCSSAETETNSEKIESSEHGPLEYIAGYVVQKLCKACRKSSKTDSSELDSLLQCLKSEHDSSSFILSRTRGGLVTPSDDLVRILHQAELHFRVAVQGKQVLRNIDVDSICFVTISSPIVKSLWDMQKLCLENVVKLYLKVRSFSYARKYITQFKIKEKQGKKKALRKDLKLDS